MAPPTPAKPTNAKASEPPIFKASRKVTVDIGLSSIPSGYSQYAAPKPATATMDPKSTPAQSKLVPGVILYAPYPESISAILGRLRGRRGSSLGPARCLKQPALSRGITRPEAP